MTEKAKHYVFISYARKDGKELAIRIQQALEAHHITTWYDLRDIVPFEDFSAEIEIAIRYAKYVVVCLTPSICSRDDSFVRREIIYAQNQKKPIIPLLFPQAEVPILINHLTWIPFYSGKHPGQSLNFESGMEMLLKRLKEFPGYCPRTPTEEEPYLEYLTTLYDEIVDFLEANIFSFITLRAETTQHAVAPTQPSHRRSRALPISFSSAALKVRTRKIDKRLQKKPGRLFKSFADAFTHYHGRVLMLGAPGAGKTTTLMAYAREAIARRMENPQQPLPLMARISDWPSHEAPSLAKWFGDTIGQLESKQVAQTISQGKGLLLLDGLDEPGSERIDPETKGRYDPRRRFMQIIPENNRVIVTCRTKDFEAVEEKIGLNGVVMLQPLEDRQMAEYLRDHPDLWSVLQADDTLRDIARVPLLLSLFTFAFDQSTNYDRQLKELKDSPGNQRDKILETYIHRRFEHEALKPYGDVKFTLDEIYKVLGRLAVEDVFSSNDHSQNNITQCDLEGVITGERSTEFIELAIRLHLLVPDEKKSGWRFIHLLLRDYFAFGYAIRHVSRGGDESDSLYMRCIDALGKLGDPRGFDSLVYALQSKDRIIRKEAVEALGRLGDARAIEPLIEVLGDQEAFVSASAADALGKLGDPRAIASLVKSLSDDRACPGFFYSQVNYHAYAALVDIGTKEALKACKNWKGYGEYEARLKHEVERYMDYQEYGHLWE